MKIYATNLIFAFFVLVLPATAGEQGDITLFFSPRGGCEAAIVSAIDNAELNVSVAAYSFSSKPIGTALYRAVKRGVFVRVLLDKSQPTAHYSMVNELQEGGLAVRIDRREAIMHMKTIVIDSKLVITGSYNFTKSAETRNAEILLFIISPAIAEQTLKNWFKHWNHAKPYSVKYVSHPNDNAPATKPACQNGSCLQAPSTTTPTYRFRRPYRWSKLQAQCFR